MLRRAISTAGGVTEMATRLRRSRDWLNRVLLGNRALGPEMCLRLALESGEDPLVVLRAAGRIELADLLHRMGFGLREIPLADIALLSDIHSLPERQQEALRLLIRSLVEQR